MRNFGTMPSLKIFLLFGVVFGPTIIQGQSCQRTNPDRDNNCVKECSLSIGCTSDKRKCICDGDCGYSCVKEDFRCPRLVKPANGKRVYIDGGRKFNKTAKFTCNQGFVLVGSSVRTCRGNEAWDGVQPICGEKCKDPGISNNNTLRHEQIRDDGFLPLQVLHYHCVSGYLIEGKNSITCQADGTWDGSSPQCYQISCQPPKLPANSEVSRPTWFNASQGAKNGRALYLTCNPGYHKSGSLSLMTCQNGQWNLPTSFKCSPKICGDPGTPANGYKEGLLYHFKSKVTFHCKKCYTLVGAAYRVCNADQSWSDETPTCQKAQKKCNKKTSISIGNGTAKSSSPEPVNCGDNIIFSCNKGYKLVGSQQIVCDENGRWSDEMPSCKPVSCPQFTNSSTVHANISGYHYLSTAYFSCKEHYVLSGKNSSSCKENGEWSGEFPECLAPCRVNASENLKSEKMFRHGTKADLKCGERFKLAGGINGDLPDCFNGTWKFRGKTFPYCIDIFQAKKEEEDFWSVK